MELRDQIALEAMKIMLTDALSISRSAEQAERLMRGIAPSSYQYADEMMKARGRGVEVKIEPRADKNYANQVYSRMSLGGVRMEEDKVLEVFTVKA